MLVIRCTKVHRISIYFQQYPYGRSFPCADTVFERILHEWKQEQRSYQSSEGVAYYGEVDTRLVGETHFLQLDIMRGELYLFFQRHQVVAGFRQDIAHDAG